MRGFGMSARMARRTRIAAAIATATCAVLGAPAIASAADITVNDDAAGNGPAGANCAAPDHATIPAAVAAANASGDRILVCAGTYTQPQVLIDKSLDLIGAGPGEAIIDGGDAAGMPSAGLIRTNDSTNGDVLVHGFTVQNAGATGSGLSVTIAAKGNDPGTTQEFADLEVVGEGTGGADYGFYADNNDPDVILRDSTFTGTDFNPVLIERADGAMTIRNNEIVADESGSAIFTMNHSNDPTTNPLRFIGNEIDAGGQSGVVVQSSFGNLGSPGAFNAVDIRNNEITDVNTIGIAVTNPTAGNGVAGEIVNVDVAENTIGTVAPDTGTGIRIQGLVRNVAITGNTLTENATGVLVNTASAGHGPVEVQARFNRIAGNPIAGLTSNAAEPVDAERNWWGCNEGPGAPGCDNVTGTGSVDFDPWLVLGLTATPGVIDARGDTSALVADLTTDSNGDEAGPGFPEATPIGFATTLGTVQTPVETAAGTATSTLASGNEGGVADVTATLDNASAAAQVGINPPPADPREVEPTPRAADLRLAVTPKRKAIDGGETIRYSATVRNAGESTATEMVLCARTPKKLELLGDACAQIGDLAPGEEFKAQFTIAAPDIPKRTFRVRFNAAGADVKGAKTRAKLKIRN